MPSVLRSIGMSCFLGYCLLGGAAASDAIVFINASIIDGTGEAPFQGWVEIRGSTIHRVEKAGMAEPSSSARIVDLSGKSLLPGFIDAHVHISDADQAARALRSGVTTARSMGVAHYADIGLRELIRKGAVQGPQLLAAGYHVRPQLAESYFLHEPNLFEFMQGVSGPDAYRRVAAANVRREVDFVKVVATDRAGLPDTDPRRQIMSEEELRAVVKEAGLKGIPVAAHAHGVEGGRAAVKAGVRSIEHGTYLDEATLRLMKETGTYLVPTVAVVRDLTQPGGDYDNTVLRLRGRHMLQRVRKTVAMAHQIGVRIVAATDTGYGSQSLLRIQHEIQELSECGLSPLQSVEAATSSAARLLGLEVATGSILAGLEADLVVVEGQPLEDLTLLEDPLMVISDGQIMLDRITP